MTASSRPTWIAQLIKMTFPGRFVAARATKVPVLGNAIDQALFGGDHLICLPQRRRHPHQRTHRNSRRDGTSLAGRRAFHRAGQHPLDHGRLHLPGQQPVPRLSHRPGLPLSWGGGSGDQPQAGTPREQTGSPEPCAALPRSWTGAHDRPQQAGCSLARRRTRRPAAYHLQLLPVLLSLGRAAPARLPDWGQSTNAWPASAYV